MPFRNLKSGVMITVRTLCYRAALAPLLLLTSLSAQAETWVIDKEDSQVIFKY